MQQPQDLIQNVHQDRDGGLLPLRILGIESCLGQLDIPVAVGIPDEVVDLLNSHAQLILFQILCHIGDQAVEL